MKSKASNLGVFLLVAIHVSYSFVSVDITQILFLIKEKYSHDFD